MRATGTTYVAAFGCIAGLLCAESAAIATAGSKDQSAFLFWTLPLCAGVSAQFALLANHRLSKTRLSVLALLSILVGFVEGIAYTFVVALFLGPWIGAFSMPILYCWAGAGATASLAAVLAVRKGVLAAILGAIGTGALTGTALVLGPQAVNAVQQGREVEVVVFRYRADDHQRIAYHGHTELTETEDRDLRRLVPDGSLTFTKRYRCGSGKRTRVVLVLRKPVVTAMKFQLPADGTLFIVQQENDWAESPKHGERLQRIITLEDRQASWEGRDWTSTDFTVETPGSLRGTNAIDWDQK